VVPHALLDAARNLSDTVFENQKEQASQVPPQETNLKMAVFRLASRLGYLARIAARPSSPG
jgi:hypothetical protein